MDGRAHELFALPPAEQAPRQASWLRRELGPLKLRTWLMLGCTVALGCLLFVGGPSARPVTSKARTAEPVARPLKVAPSSVVTLVGFAKPSPLQKQAAELLIAGRTEAALAVYRKLAAQEETYRPIVRMLERKTSCRDPRCAR